VLEALAGDLRPASWEDLLETVRVLNVLIAPEVIAAIAERGQAGPGSRAVAGRVGSRN
jgi:hypothetical protein